MLTTESLTKVETCFATRTPRRPTSFMRAMRKILVATTLATTLAVAIATVASSPAFAQNDVTGAPCLYPNQMCGHYPYNESEPATCFAHVFANNPGRFVDAEPSTSVEPDPHSLVGSPFDTGLTPLGGSTNRVVNYNDDMNVYEITTVGYYDAHNAWHTVPGDWFRISTSGWTEWYWNANDGRYDPYLSVGFDSIILPTLSMASLIGVPAAARYWTETEFWWPGYDHRPQGGVYQPPYSHTDPWLPVASGNC